MPVASMLRAGLFFVNERRSAGRWSLSKLSSFCSMDSLESPKRS